MLATLRTYQDRVLALAAEAERLLTGEGRGAVAQISRIRIEQGVAMAAYQLFVHREIFAPLVRGEDAAAAEAAKQLKVSCIAFSNAFAHYMQEWSRRDPAAEWGSYQPAALAMVADIRSHVTQVRDLLAPGLQRLDTRENRAAVSIGY